MGDLPDKDAEMRSREPLPQVVGPARSGQPRGPERAGTVGAAGRSGRLVDTARRDAPGPAGSFASDGLPGSAASSGRSGGAISRLLGLDRRPRVGGSRPPRHTEREPAWEQPRRFEAYPTLKTRVGLPVPSPLVIGVGALILAAAVLFFVPPLLLKQGGDAGPSATPDAAASASEPAGSATATVAPTPQPPKQQTYRVKAGDTVVGIAKRFGLTMEALLAANKNIKNPDKIAIGDVIVIPSAAPTEIVDGGASASP